MKIQRTIACGGSLLLRRAKGRSKKKTHLNERPAFSCERVSSKKNTHTENLGRETNIFGSILSTVARFFSRSRFLTHAETILCPQNHRGSEINANEEKKVTVGVVCHDLAPPNKRFGFTKSCIRRVTKVVQVQVQRVQDI